MAYEFFISRRYMRAKRKQVFVSIITFISIFGIFLGVATLIIVLAVMNGFEPVSYTHLRAHETVIDLVCRLLLEKKKKQ